MMIQPSDLKAHVHPHAFIQDVVAAVTSARVESLLAQLPIVNPNDYLFNSKNPYEGWIEGWFHWYPVGADRGNAGRIKLAGNPINPIGERTINGMEALIEMYRQLELKQGPSERPDNPRAAVTRYFDLPPLDEIPRWAQAIRGYKPREYARKLATALRIRLMREAKSAEYAIGIEDDGIGQPAEMMHKTLLSLGNSDKVEKPYLIGVFGQGGSSAYAASEFSWIMTRRHPDLLNGVDDEVGWTVVKHMFTKGRRDTYFAYLAAHPDGRVPTLPSSAADSIGFKHGTRFTHVDYDFGKTEPARRLYPALNHLLFNPVLPYELYTGPARPPDPMYGNAYRLSLRSEKDKANILDKSFDSLPVMKG